MAKCSESGGLPISKVAEAFGKPDGLVVIDKTGLLGNYEFTLRYTPEPNPNDDRPSLFTALEEQLGLKLVPDPSTLSISVTSKLRARDHDYARRAGVADS